MQTYITKFPKLFPHQKAFIEKNPRKAIMAWEMRVSKTLPACYWVDNPCRSGNTYIICIKQNIEEWKAMGSNATVLTKEQFKKNVNTIVNPSAIVVDEASFFASPLFTKDRSQLATALYGLCKAYPEMDVLLLTATPVRQNAWSLHSLLCYIGVYYDWKKWRSEFFELVRLPFLRFPTWMPKKDWRIKIRPFLEKHCNIVSLKDIVDYLPEPQTTIINVSHSKKYTKPIDETVTWIDEHKYEQQDKVEHILALGYKKLIVVAHFTYQIDELAKELAKDKTVFILDGRTKNPDEIKKLAQEEEECYLIVQASMGMGWDGWMFGAIVFASMSHSVLNHTQMSGRTRHLNHLVPTFFYYLIGGKWDKRIYDTIKAGKEFNPHIYLHE